MRSQRRRLCAPLVLDIYWVCYRCVIDVLNSLEKHTVHLSQAQYIKTSLKVYQQYITKYNIGEDDSPMDNRKKKKKEKKKEILAKNANGT
jgi:hypothetical protein